MSNITTETETTYLIRLSAAAAGEALDNPEPLLAELRAAVREAAKGSNGHAADKPARHIKTGSPQKLGGVKRKYAKRQPKAGSERVQCPHCELSFKRQGNLDNHLKYSHPTEAEL